jgi:hypothetical protein
MTGDALKRFGKSRVDIAKSANGKSFFLTVIEEKVHYFMSVIHDSCGSYERYLCAKLSTSI